jgi:hypothetical protein
LFPHPFVTLIRNDGGQVRNDKEARNGVKIMNYLVASWFWYIGQTSFIITIERKEKLEE